MEILLRYFVEKPRDIQLPDIRIEGRFVDSVHDVHERINFIIKLTKQMSYQGNWYASKGLEYLRLIPDFDFKKDYSEIKHLEITGIVCGSQVYIEPFDSKVHLQSTIEHYCILNPSNVENS